MAGNVTKVTLNKLSNIPVKVPSVSNDAKTYSQKAEQAAQQAQDALEEVKKIQEEIESGGIIVNCDSPYDTSTIYDKNILVDNSSVSDISGVYIYIPKGELPGAIKLKEIKLQNRASLGTCLSTECYAHLWELVNNTWIPLGISTNKAKQDLAAITTWEFEDIKSRGGDLYISFHTTQNQNVTIIAGNTFGCQCSNMNTNTVVGTVSAPITTAPDLILRYNASYFTDYQHSQDQDKHITEEIKEHLVLDNQEVTFEQPVSIKKQLIASTIVNEQGKRYVTEDQLENLVVGGTGVTKITGYNDGVETSSVLGSAITITDHRGANALVQDFCKDKVNFDGSTVQIFTNATNGANLYEGYDITKIKNKKATRQSGGSFILDTDLLEDGTRMFANNIYLQEIHCNLDNLVTGTEMFIENDQLKSFAIDMPSLINGDRMFQGCGDLKTYYSNMSNLQSAVDIFNGCKLQPESLLVLLDTIPDVENGDLGIISIDGSLPEEEYTDMLFVNTLDEIVSLFKDKGWSVTLQQN